MWQSAQIPLTLPIRLAAVIMLCYKSVNIKIFVNNCERSLILVKLQCELLNLFLFVYFLSCAVFPEIYYYTFILLQRRIIHHEDRVVCLLWLQDLPWPWQISGQGRWQEPQVDNFVLDGVTTTSSMGISLHLQ